MARFSSASERVIKAPPPEPPAATDIPDDSVEEATIKQGEDVEWLWSETADGTRYVSGYRVLDYDGEKATVGGGWMVFQRKESDSRAGD